MNTDLISIVVPCFNNEKDIQETIDSIIGQTYHNWEIIIVDDGSQDKTLDIAKENAQKDPRIRCFSRGRLPKGGSTCRNIGLSHAKGEYLIFLDADDLLAPTCLENRWVKIHNTNNEFMVFPMATFTKSIEQNRRLTKWGVKDFDYYYMTGAPVWQVTSPIYKTDFLKRLGGFDENFLRFQDVELGLRSVVYSKGNFTSVESVDCDCFYRMPLTGYSVPSTKYINVLKSYKFFLSLFLRLRNEGYLNNKYKYSLGLLASYCYMIQMLNILKLRNDEVESFEYYNAIDLRKQMLWMHRIILFFLNKNFLPLKAHRYLAFKCNQYCRIHFM